MWRFRARRVAALGGGATVAIYAAYRIWGDDLFPFLPINSENPRSPQPSFFPRSPLLADGPAISPSSTTRSSSSLANSSSTSSSVKPHALWKPPSREEILNLLKGKNKDGSSKFAPKAEGQDDGFDLLIVGGGATGVGCALDAVTRGLKVALVERDDFSSGTSSRSTKLVHGGVRYLEKAFLEADYEQYKLVKEALHERGVFLRIAPYLSYQLPIMLPIYQLRSKAYDLLAGSEGLSKSYFLSKRRALEAFPMLKRDRLAGAMVYYDGAHNDSRMNVALAMTAIAHGAVCANHVEVVELIKRPRVRGRRWQRPQGEQQSVDQEKGSSGSVVSVVKETFDKLIGSGFGIGGSGALKNVAFGDEEICGAIVRDLLTGETWTVKAKGVINATGPFTDTLRKMDNPSLSPIVAPSAGVHIILPGYYSPRHMGLVDPATSDGRVIFFLPWLGNTIAGTTDSPTEVTYSPEPSEKDITWILKEVENYLSPEIKVRRGDVLAAWSGIRPLVRDPNAKNTAALVRNHMIHVSPAGLLTIAGGKWTTYRAMAEETIDYAIQVFDLEPTISQHSVTENTLLVGSHGWSKNLFVKLVQHFGLETEIAEHLSDSYGDRAWAVASLATLTNKRWPVFGKRLVQSYPYIEAEVRYACQREYACTVVDVLARRTRLAFLNATAAWEAVPRVIEIMGEELGWDSERLLKEYEDTYDFLLTMGLQKKAKSLIELPNATTSKSRSWSGWMFGSSSTAATAPTAPPKRRTPTASDVGLGVEPSSPPVTDADLDEDEESDDLPTFYTRSHFRPEELARYRLEFSKLDRDGDGHISDKDLSKVLVELGLRMTETEMERVIAEVDLNKSGAIEFSEFLEVLGAVKEIKSRSRFARIIAEYEEREKFSTDRSGGGV
ncbi:mitochondrial glycerol-3-phosphate dehydrogenase [Quaeritorhiza haematococci]|nr:mitochondrial glycerol-3-phosphate dehydrogenase [Quaeritorhiza haematococci]